MCGCTALGRWSVAGSVHSPPLSTQLYPILLCFLQSKRYGDITLNSTADTVSCALNVRQLWDESEMVCRRAPLRLPPSSPKRLRVTRAREPGKRPLGEQ